MYSLGILFLALLVSSGNSLSVKGRDERLTVNRDNNLNRVYKSLLNTQVKTPISSPTFVTTASTCKSVVGYYVGKFQFASSTQNSGFYAQFEFRVTADKENNQIKLQIEHLNQTYTGTDVIYFTLNDEKNMEICETTTSGCTIPFPRKKTDLLLSIDNNHDFVDIMYFKDFSEDFSLKNPTGQCSNSQISGARFPPDSSLMDYCVCCDDYVSSNDKLQCPADLFQQTNTSKDSTIVGYYIGKFEDWNGQDAFDAQFQVKVVANQTARRIQATIEFQNKTYAGNEEVHLMLYDYSGGTFLNCYFSTVDCSIPFATSETQDLQVLIGKLGSQHYNTIMFFKGYNNTLTFDNPVGGCTNTQAAGGIDGIDGTAVSYCICYNEYKDSGILPCPTDPWVH